jgi:ankyrin repeat protein
VVAWLIAQKVDVNYHLTNDPALFYAVGHGHLSTVELLLAAHARTDIAPVPNPGEKNPSTILSLAAMSNQLEMLQLILDTGAHINERDNLGYTALLEASLNANPEMVTCLLDHGADLNLGNYAGLTPLMAVAENKSISLLHLFVQRGARVQDRDCDGRTALILCAMIGADDQVRELLADKADVNVADKLGETALTYAGDRGDTRMVHVLKLAGATRDDLHIIPKATPSIPLSPARRWALAVGALYAQVNADSHEMIDTPGKRFGAKRLLDRQWDVRDRESLLARLKDLEQGSTFTSVVFSQVRESGLEHGIEAKLERAFQFLFLDLWWRSKTDVAWNHCRAANLVRLGVEAGFLKETEAWQILIPIARHAQSAFSSWKEMSENFLDFREIGADERSGDFRAAAGLLLNPNDPNSPWNALPWKTDLSAQ